MLLLLIMSPGDQLPEGPKIPGLDKIIHFSLFAGLLFLWNRAIMDKDESLPTKRFITNHLVLGIIFAILAEEMQQLAPNRSFDLTDIVANLTGSLIGTLCFYILYKKKSKLV
ncbi:VanZ family protein [Echinicola marina]|nr:VanZ family protein [Echinicola marina]